jgi:hypothetical protein
MAPKIANVFINNLSAFNSRFQVWIPAEDDDEVSQRKGETVSASSIIYPYVLPKIYASIFMLYALHYKKEDDEYWAR